MTVQGPNTEATDRPLQIFDDALGAAEVLTGAGCTEVISAAFPSAPIDQVTRTQVIYRPGETLTVLYRVESGQDEAVVAARTGGLLPSAALRLGSGGDEVAVWRFPEDPRLPGLARAIDPESVRGLLSQLGVDTGLPELKVRSYRPLRRAVVEVFAAPHRIFLKVVRPERVERLQEIHRALTAVPLPIPRSLGWDRSAGLVVLEALPGKTLSATLRGRGGTRIPDPATIITLLDRLASVELAEPQERQTLLERAPDHARILQVVAPDLSDRLDALLDAIGPESRHDSKLLTHGDLHAGQIVIEDSAVPGLIDVDTVGLGLRADDLANLLAQIECVAGSSGGGAVRSYLDLLREAFGRLTDPTDLDVRTAAALAGYSVGPFRGQESDWERETLRRLQAAEALVGTGSAQESAS